MCTKKHLLNYRWICAYLSTFVILQCSSVDVGSFSIWPLDPSAVAEDAKAPTNKMERCKNRSLAEKCIFSKNVCSTGEKVFRWCRCRRRYNNFRRLFVCRWRSFMSASMPTLTLSMPTLSMSMQESGKKRESYFSGEATFCCSFPKI